MHDSVFLGLATATWIVLGVGLLTIGINIYGLATKRPPWVLKTIKSKWYLIAFRILMIINTIALMVLMCIPDDVMMRWSSARQGSPWEFLVLVMIVLLSSISNDKRSSSIPITPRDRRTHLVLVLILVALLVILLLSVLYIQSKIG